MAATLKVGQSAAATIRYLDQDGKPMEIAQTPDAMPQWGQTTPATTRVTPLPGSLTADIVALAAGTDTIRLILSVGGDQFTATLDIEVEAPAQVLTSIGIALETPTP